MLPQLTSFIRYQSTTVNFVLLHHIMALSPTKMQKHCRDCKKAELDQTVCREKGAAYQ